MPSPNVEKFFAFSFKKEVLPLAALPVAQNIDSPKPLHQNTPKIVQRQCHATLRRRVIGPGDVQKNRRAAITHDGRIVPAENDDQVVERVVAPKLLVPSIVRQHDVPVIISVCRVVAPAVGSGEWLGGDRTVRGFSTRSAR